MGTMAITGILEAMTQRVQRQQELIDQLRFDLETQSLENQGLARELAVAIDEISRSNETSRQNRWDLTGNEVDSNSRLFRLRLQAGEKNESLHCKEDWKTRRQYMGSPGYSEVETSCLEGRSQGAD